MTLTDSERQEIANNANDWNAKTRGYKGRTITVEDVKRVELHDNDITHPIDIFIASQIISHGGPLKITSKRRHFTRIDAILKAYNPESEPSFVRKQGKYIDAALLFQTPIELCSIASRLSHEAWDKASYENDAALLMKLLKAGDEHGKSLRGLLYYIVIEAPRYLWPELDTYQVGVEKLGSSSTMHKEAKNLTGDELVEFKENLTEGTLQARLWIFSEPTLQRIVRQRNKHRLPDWHELCDFINSIIRYPVLP